MSWKTRSSILRICLGRRRHATQLWKSRSSRSPKRMRHCKGSWILRIHLSLEERAPPMRSISCWTPTMRETSTSGKLRRPRWHLSWGNWRVQCDWRMTRLPRESRDLPSSMRESSNSILMHMRSSVMSCTKRMPNSRMPTYSLRMTCMHYCLSRRRTLNLSAVVSTI